MKKELLYFMSIFWAAPFLQSDSVYISKDPLIVRNNTGRSIVVSVYFLYNDTERLFPCHEVTLDKDNKEWRCLIGDFPARDIAKQLNLTSEKEEKANNTVGPFLDMKILKQGKNDIVIEPAQKIRIIRSGTLGVVVSKIKDDTGADKNILDAMPVDANLPSK